MPMYFGGFQVYSHEPFLTIEKAVKVAASVADIHKFEAYNQLFEAVWTDVNAVSGYTGGSILGSGDDLLMGTAGSEKMTRVRSVDRTVRFRTSGSGAFKGVIFVSGDGEPKPDTYVLGYDDIDFALFRPGASGLSYERQAFSIIMAPPASGETVYEIQFAERRYSSATNEYIVTVSLYMNDKLIQTFVHKRATSLSEYPFHYIGFRGAFNYYDVHISGAAELSDPLTIDPGEVPAGGLSRTIDGLNFKMMLRYNETLRVFRTTKGPNAPATWSVDHEDIVPGSIEYERQPSALFPRVRVVGAYEEAEYINNEWAELLGDRFTLVNNPYLLTLAAIKTEVRAVFLRMLEAYLRASFTTQHNPFIEPEDQIEVLGDPYLVTGFQVTWSQNEASQSFEVRNNPHEA